MGSRIDLEDVKKDGPNRVNEESNDPNSIGESMFLS